MYSIIVCSIRPEEAEALRENIARTIGDGVPFEFIAYDNRGTGKGICQVYNECAERAKYSNLCFVHEDVEFLTQGWGRILVEKLSEPDCGIIGFAGSTMKSKTITGWGATTYYGSRQHFVQRRKKKDLFIVDNPAGEAYSQVVTIDGMCMFVRKDVWANLRFDDKMLTGFHCYDLDFSIACHMAGYRNWVAQEVLIKHMSVGNYTMGWYNSSVDLHEKWGAVLPIYIEQLSDEFKAVVERKTVKEWRSMMGTYGIYEECSSASVARYLLTHPFNRRAYRMVKGWIKYKRRKQR
jgi:hypothetical protein